MKDRSHSGLRSAAVFSLCALFALLAMGLTLLSSGVYRDTVRAADENYIHRTALSYLVNQVRRADAEGCVAVGSFGEGGALRLTEQVDGEDYLTLLYCYDGQLRELYMASDAGLLPADGIAILPLEHLSVALEEGLLRIGAEETDGRTYTVSLAPRCAVEEVGAL